MKAEFPFSEIALTGMFLIGPKYMAIYFYICLIFLTMPTYSIMHYLLAVKHYHPSIIHVFLECPATVE